MAWIDQKSNFNLGFKMYLYFIIPESLLLINFPLNGAIFRLGLSGDIDKFIIEATGTMSLFLLIMYGITSIYRILLCLIGKYSKESIIKSHGNWLTNTIAFNYLIFSFAILIIGYIIHNTLSGVPVTNESLLIVFITTLCCGITVIWSIYREVKGFLNFMNLETPYQPIFK